MLRLLAPAKINLALEILGKRSDGYHEIRTILQSINLYDKLSFEPAKELELEIAGDNGNLPIEGNLIIKAAEALQTASGTHLGAVIRLEKHIPISSGLGGGSSDAAQTLIGLRALWELDISDNTLSSLGATIGSDVPFFLRGGTAEASGRGEVISQLPDIPETSFFITIPTVLRDSLKTQSAYSQVNTHNFTNGHLVKQLAECVRNQDGFEHLLSNTFDSLSESFSPSTTDIRRRLGQMSDKIPVLCGSGPSMFVVVDNQTETQAWSSHMNKAGYQTFTAKTQKLWNTGGIRVDAD